jgi:ADP-L-glycero-D-manno-heptose 6-epimerase
MRAIVTGHYGFIGGNLMSRLREKGYEVFGIDREIFFMWDWKEALMVTLEANKPEVVFHVGANSDTLETDINQMMGENFDFTYGLAMWCQMNGVKLIYSSSASIYGNESGGMNLYAWSKYGGEAVTTMMGGVSLRYFNVYGHGEEQKGAMASVMYQAWEKKKAGEYMTLFPLNPKRDFVYVDDVVDANLYAYEHYDEMGGLSYDVGVGEARSFEEVMELMKIGYRVASDVSVIPKNYQYFTKADPDKFMKGWLPKYKLEDGISKYLEYLNKEL